MLNKDTVIKWLNKNNWLILQERKYSYLTGNSTTNFIEALSPTGLSVIFDFDDAGELTTHHDPFITPNM